MIPIHSKLTRDTSARVYFLKMRVVTPTHRLRNVPRARQHANATEANEHARRHANATEANEHAR